VPLSKQEEVDLLRSLAESEVDHTDGSCGMCLKRRIMAEEARAELDSADPDFLAASNRANARWRETQHYKLYHELAEQGKTMTEIEAEFRKRGLEL
jgi:hypothetical protein